MGNNIIVLPSILLYFLHYVFISPSVLILFSTGKKICSGHVDNPGPSAGSFCYSHCDIEETSHKLLSRKSYKLFRERRGGKDKDN